MRNLRICWSALTGSSMTKYYTYLGHAGGQAVIRWRSKKKAAMTPSKAVQLYTLLLRNGYGKNFYSGQPSLFVERIGIGEKT